MTLAACHKDKEKDEPIAERTVLIYMAAQNNLTYWPYSGYRYAEGDLKECMIQCVLGFKRLENAAQGLRWLDVKRYGIEITRRTLQPDPKAEQYDAGYKILNGAVDVLTVDDPRRAVQIPPDIVSSGIEPNPR